MVFPAFRKKAIPDRLYRNLHRFLFRLRRRDQPGRDSDCKGGAGRGRRRLAASFPIDSAGKLPSSETRHCHGRIRPGRGGRAGAGTDSGGLAHRRLFLAMGFLHQHPRRCLRRFYDLALCPGSRLCSRGEAGETGRHWPGTAGHLAGLPADHSR